MTEIIYKHSAGGIIYDKGKVLVIKWISRNTIEFPKGTIEPNESSEDACVREVLEETGYKTKIIQSIGDSVINYDWDDGKSYCKTISNYLLELENDDEPTPNREENEDFENIWLDLQEAYDNLTYDHSKQELLVVAKVVSIKIII